MNDLQLIGKTLAKTVIGYFENPVNRKSFEDWYKHSYGQEYCWERSSYEKHKPKEREQVRETTM